MRFNLSSRVFIFILLLSPLTITGNFQNVFGADLTPVADLTGQWSGFAQVTITITNPKDSSSDVYGIKLTTTSGKIKNYVKVNGWDHKRINDNTVSYQTKSSPLGQSDVIKIKLKVDAKKPEITWNAYSKDQKSLGTGKVKP